MLILVAVAVVSWGISAWGFQSALAEVARFRPREDPFSLRNRFAVDDYIWNGGAPRALRRRYILCMAYAPVGALSMAGACWVGRSAAGSIGPVIAFSGVALVITVNLAWKVARHGF